MWEIKSGETGLEELDSRTSGPQSFGNSEENSHCMVGLVPRNAPWNSLGVFFRVDQPFRSYAVAKLEEETLSIARVAHAEAHRIAVGLLQLREIERNRPLFQKQHHHGTK